MDFSKKYLLKYGWEEGQGLGKTNNGIKTAIKPKLKFDKAGMGYDPSLEFTNSWWVKLYNEALEDTQIKNEEKAKSKRNEDKCADNNIKKRKFKQESFIDLFKACEGRTVHKGARQGLHLSGKLQRLEQQELTLLSKKELIGNTVKSNKSVSEHVNDKRTKDKKTNKLKKKKNMCDNSSS